MFFKREPTEQDVYTALRDGDISKVERYVKNGLDIHKVSEDDKWNLLHKILVSVMKPPSIKAVKYLLEKGIEVNAKDVYLNSPLYYATRVKSVEIVELLLRNGADVNAVNIDGITPLHESIAVLPVNREVVRILLKYGADCDIELDGLSVRELAQSPYLDESVKLWLPRLLEEYDKT